jgi:hypothetical protein
MVGFPFLASPVDLVSCRQGKKLSISRVWVVGVTSICSLSYSKILRITKCLDYWLYSRVWSFCKHCTVLLMANCIFLLTQALYSAIFLMTWIPFGSHVLYTKTTCPLISTLFVKEFAWSLWLICSCCAGFCTMHVLNTVTTRSVIKSADNFQTFKFCVGE